MTTSATTTVLNHCRHQRHPQWCRACDLAAMEPSKAPLAPCDYCLTDTPSDCLYGPPGRRMCGTCVGEKYL